MMKNGMILLVGAISLIAISSANAHANRLVNAHSDGWSWTTYARQINATQETAVVPNSEPQNAVSQEDEGSPSDRLRAQNNEGQDSEGQGPGESQAEAADGSDEIDNESSEANPVVTGCGQHTTCSPCQPPRNRCRSRCGILSRLRCR